MARLEVKFDVTELENSLSRVGDIEVAKKVVEAGAQPMADEIRNMLIALPEDQFRYLRKGEVFKGLPKQQKQDLANGFGITDADIDRNGNANIKIGFNGYGKYKTKKYPKGVPNALLARAVESGSSVRRKTPFVRTGTNKSLKETLKAMEKKLNEEIVRIMKG